MLNITHYQRNANQNYHEVPTHQLEQPSLKSQQTTNAGEDAEKWNPPTLSVQM